MTDPRFAGNSEKVEDDDTASLLPRLRPSSSLEVEDAPSGSGRISLCPANFGQECWKCALIHHTLTHEQ